MNPQDLWEALELADGLALNAAVADDTQFTQVHGITGLELPAAVQAAYLRHNGQAAGGQPLFNGQYRWLSLGEVVREWRDWQALMQDESMAEMRDAHESCGSDDHPVRLDWWNARWLPLARNDLGDLLCIDGQPTRSGVAGQIIEVFHDQEAREVVLESFEQLLAEAAADVSGET